MWVVASLNRNQMLPLTPVGFGKLCLVLLLACPLRSANGHGGATAFTYELPDKQESCFFEDYTGSSDLVFLFQVLKGGKNDVDVSIVSPNNKKLYDVVRQTRGHHEFTSSPGRYTFCFNNKFSTVTHKVVYFELRPVTHEPLAVEAGMKKPSANTQLEESMEHIHKASTDVLRFQQYHRRVEAMGRFKAEELNSRVQWYSILQSLFLIILGVGQVCVLKHFFTEKRQTTKPETAAVVHVIPVNDKVDGSQSVKPAQSV